MYGIIKVKKQKNNSSQSIALLDIISLEKLQNIQDEFAASTNVASIILDLFGNNITKPSNFSKVCNLIRNTELGKHQCNASDMERRKLADSIDQPTYLKCHPCGFADASLPVFVGNERVANWLIGQVNLNDADRSEIADYASVIGVDITEMLVAFHKMPKISSQEFEVIIKLLSEISSEIIDLCYQAYQSNDSDKESLNNAIQDKFDHLLSGYKNSFSK